MAILVTGGAGFIGSHTVVELLAVKEEIVIVDNYINSKPSVLDRIRKISGKDFKYYTLDVQDAPALEKVFAENPIDEVIHFAGLKAVGESCEQPLRYYRNNIDSTLVLLETMKKFGTRRIVFSSSATVYGKPASVPITEDFPLSATNPYGETKLMIEQILRDVAAAEKDLSVSILRYFNPVGAHPSGLMGEDPQGMPNNLFPCITRTGCGKMPYVSVFGDDYETEDGTGIRDFIHVVDLAKAHLCALRRARQVTGVETYNIGTGRGFSVFEMIHTFEKITGREVPYRVVGRRPGDIGVCYANPALAEKMLHWKAELGLEEICRDAYRWQMQNPDGYPD